jgi:hypothetical protein
LFGSCAVSYDLDFALSLVERHSVSGYKYANFGRTKGELIDQYYDSPFAELTAVGKAHKWFLGGCSDFSMAHIGKKDEIRALEKVADGKVRSFMIMPFDHYLASILMFYHICETLKTKFTTELFNLTNDFEIYSAFGSDRFHLCYDRFLRSEGIIADGDGHAWDRSCARVFFSVVRDLFYKMLHPLYRNSFVYTCFWNLFAMMVDTPFVFDRHMCVKHHGMPSGAYLTLVVNCIIHILVLLYGKMRSAGILRAVCFGDDLLAYLLMNIRPELRLAYSDCGFDYEFNDEHEFLKSHVVWCTYNNNTYPCLVPHRDNVISSLAWRHKSNLHASLDELDGCFLRACSFRQLCWPDKELIKIIDDFFQFLVSYNFKGTTYGEHERFRAIASNYPTDDVCNLLWFTRGFLY